MPWLPILIVAGAVGIRDALGDVSVAPAVSSSRRNFGWLVTVPFPVAVVVSTSATIRKVRLNGLHLCP